MPRFARFSVVEHDFVKFGVVDQEPPAQRKAGHVPVAVSPPNIVVRIKFTGMKLLGRVVVDAADIERQRGVGGSQIVGVMPNSGLVSSIR